MSEIETRQELTRTEVAAYLREFAAQLDQTETTSQSGGMQGSIPTDSPDITSGDTDSGATPADGTVEGSEPAPHEQTEPAASGQNDTATNEQAEPAAEGQTTKQDGRVTFLVGNDSATINPPENVAFDVAVGSDSSLMEMSEQREVGFTISWDAADEPEDDDLSIE
ncbi:amphi-Trp domain-containing protein [Haloarchaeobius sp. TZWWS8]|uniref:amphi-Trp domain-containing protein n=1 Tax=Haloarchaeobius sp. TZWWS8 TaxID=3446121 RepID=UPI003EBCF0FF